MQTLSEHQYCSERFISIVHAAALTNTSIKFSAKNCHKPMLLPLLEHFSGD
jgi:hypothetical protein